MPRIYHQRCLYLVLQLILLTCLVTHYFHSKSFIKMFGGNRRGRVVPYVNATIERFISNKINYLNAEERVLNAEFKLKDNPEENPVVIVVLVENYSEDFNTFLTSLSEITGIEDTLVVFSHSVYDENLNDIIRKINFCRVLQIFFPFSVQTHSRRFPGLDKHDCHSDMTIEYAQMINCTGAYFPDIKGYYRDPLVSERKHHWWWTANQVFENLKCTKHHKGLVIFVETDLIFTKDFIYMATFLENLVRTVPRCEFISLRMYSASDMRADETNIYAAEYTVWDPKVHSVLAFNITTWNVIASYYNLFCDFDDASWSYSVNHVAVNRKDEPNFKVMATVMPRAFTINQCKGYYCDSTTVDKIKDWLNTTEKLWFPLYVELSYEIWKDLEALEAERPGGGWADPRDKDLCYKMTANKMRKVIMELLQY